MPVDRSVSGIRLSGPSEKRRRATRFPTHIPAGMNHRRPSPRPGGGHPTDATMERHRHRAALQPSEPPAPTTWRTPVDHRPDRKTVQIGRVGAHAPAAAGPTESGTPAQQQQPRAGHRRRPARALVVGLLLAAAIVGGAGVAALAMGATPAPATGEPAAISAPESGSVAVVDPAVVDPAVLILLSLIPQWLVPQWLIQHRLIPLLQGPPRRRQRLTPQGRRRVR